MRPAAASEPRIVVTGLGAVSAWGWGVEPLRRGLASGQTAIGPIRQLDARGQRTTVAGEVPPAPPELAERFRDWEHLARADRFAVAAATEAMAQAGIDAAGELNIGVYFGGSTAGMLECEEYMARLTGCAPGRPRLGLLASQQINGPGDAVARALSVTGPVGTFSSACASGGLAIGMALDALRSRQVDVAVTGGADALCRLTYSGFNSLRSVDPAPCRPFRPDRVGLSIGEGAGILILETLERVTQRGGTPLAVLLGCGASCDAHHMTAPHPEGEGAALAIASALRDAGVPADAVSCVNTHGTGTLHNDESEARALRSVFGERAARIPLTATKGSVGHLLGCSGAIEAVATVLALLDRALQPTPGDGLVDPALGVDLVLGQPRPLPERAVAISTSFAFGGANAAVVIGSCEGKTGA